MERSNFSSLQALEQDIERVELEILSRAAARLDAIQNDPSHAEECRRLRHIIQSSMRSLQLDQSLAR